MGSEALPENWNQQAGRRLQGQRHLAPGKESRGVTSVKRGGRNENHNETLSPVEDPLPPGDL